VKSFAADASRPHRARPSFLPDQPRTKRREAYRFSTANSRTRSRTAMAMVFLTSRGEEHHAPDAQDQELDVAHLLTKEAAKAFSVSSWSRSGVGELLVDGARHRTASSGFATRTCTNPPGPYRGPSARPGNPSGTELVVSSASGRPVDGRTLTPIPRENGPGWECGHPASIEALPRPTPITQPSLSVRNACH